MADLNLSAGNVRVGLTGNIYWSPDGSATVPTSATAVLTGWDVGGYVSEDGVVLTMPEAGDSTPIKAWQNGATVRVLRAAPDEFPQITATFIETKLEVIELVFGVEITQSASDGKFTINTNEQRKEIPLVFDVVDGDQVIRVYAPKAQVISVGEITFKTDEAVGYETTISLNHDDALGGQATVWMTALKTATQTQSLGL